jgi:hypothetical protein
MHQTPDTNRRQPAPAFVLNLPLWIIHHAPPLGTEAPDVH